MGSQIKEPAMPGFVDATCVSNNKISSTYQDLVFEMPAGFNFMAQERYK